MPRENDFHVTVVESPSYREITHGKTEGKVLQPQLELAEISHDYHKIYSAVHFGDVISERIFYQQCIFPVRQFLHISCHGSEAGVGFTDGTSLTWRQLANYLRPLHRVSPGGIGVCLTSCYGACGIEMAEVLSGALVPFTWLIASKNKVNLYDVAAGYPVFYNGYRRGDTPEQSIDCLRQSCGDHEIYMKFGPTTQQIYSSAFCHALRDWLFGVARGSFARI